MRPNDGRVVSNFIVQALGGFPLTIYGDGSQTRSFCYVSDLISGIVRLLQAPAAETIGLNDHGVHAVDTDVDNAGAGLDATSDDIHYPVNIGNPSEFTVLELARRVIDMTSSHSRIEHKPLPVDDPRVRQPDISRARRLLGWEPRVELDEGLKRTIEYFRSAASAPQK